LPTTSTGEHCPVRSCPSQLNSVSRTRFGVGRSALLGGNAIIRLRQAPPTMRTLFIMAAQAVLALLARGGARDPFAIGADDHSHHALGLDAPRECALDVGHRAAIDVLHEVLEIRVRQPVSP